MRTTLQAVLGASVFLAATSPWLPAQAPPSRFIVPDALKNFEVMQNGKLVTQSVVQPASGARTLALAPGSVSVVYASAKVSAIAATAKKKVNLPAHIVVAPPAAGGKAESGFPSLFFDSAPMVWDPKAKTYSSPITVALEPDPGSKASAGKVTIELTVEYGALSSNHPIALSIGESTNLVVTSKQFAQPVGVTMIVGGAKLPEVTAKVLGTLASIDLQAETSQPEAFTGTTALNLSIFDPQPMPLTLPADLPVTFTVDGPGQSIDAIKIPANSSAAKALFRAGAPGPVSITASAAGISVTKKILVVSTARKLSFVANSPKALGLGFGKIDVTVTRIDANGNPVADAAGLSVPVTVTAGQLSSAMVQIPGGAASATFSVTDADTGSVQVNSSGGAVASALTLSFVWPWAIVVATLIGSALGAYLRWIKLGASSARSFPKLAGEAAAVSVTVVAAVLLGIKYGPLPQALAATEGGAFFLGIFAGVTGVVALDTLFAPADKKDTGSAASTA